MKIGILALAVASLSALPFLGATSAAYTVGSGTTELSSTTVPSPDPVTASLIQGVVHDGPTSRPLGGVQVWLDGRTEATLTNPAGRYVLTVEGAHMVGQDVTVRVGALGYAEEVAKVRLTAGTVSRNFTLTPEELVSR